MLKGREGERREVCALVFVCGSDMEGKLGDYMCCVWDNGKMLVVCVGASEGLNGAGKKRFSWMGMWCELVGWTCFWIFDLDHFF